jgi:hypothetical protein
LRFDAASAAQPFTNLYYTVELPGVYKYIALTSYAPGQTFSADEEQYVWLERELQQVCWWWWGGVTLIVPSLSLRGWQ